MKLNLKKLDQRGFDHVMAVVAFVVLFALVGTALIVSTRAATTTSYVQLRLNNNNVCLTGENIATCSTGNREMLYVKPVAGSSNFQLRNAAGYCIDDWNHAYQSKPAAQGGTRINARLNTCYGNDKNQQWSWKGTGNHELANAGNNYQGCLNSAGALTANNNPVIIYACNNSWNENWNEVSVKLNTSTTPTAPTWTLTGTTSITKISQRTIMFKNTITNIGSKASGNFKYGPRFFFASTANPAFNAGGTYAGEITQGADVTYALKARTAYVVNQAVVIPQSDTSGYACGNDRLQPAHQHRAHEWQKRRGLRKHRRAPLTEGTKFLGWLPLEYLWWRTQGNLDPFFSDIKDSCERLERLDIEAAMDGIGMSM